MVLLYSGTDVFLLLQGWHHRAAHFFSQYYCFSSSSSYILNAVLQEIIGVLLHFENIGTKLYLLVKLKLNLLGMIVSLKSNPFHANLLQIGTS